MRNWLRWSLTRPPRKEEEKHQEEDDDEDEGEKEVEAGQPLDNPLDNPQTTPWTTPSSFSCLWLGPLFWFALLLRTLAFLPVLVSRHRLHSSSVSLSSSSFLFASAVRGSAYFSRKCSPANDP